MKKEQKRIIMGAIGVLIVIIFITLVIIVSTPDSSNNESKTIESTTTSTTTTTSTSTTTTTNITDIITEILTTTNTTTTTTEVTTVQSPEDLPDNTNPPIENLKFLGNYKGTYYAVKTPCNGGSGRILVDCGINITDSYKGSVASRYIYENYGYNYQGKTMVYLEITEYPEMNGWYSVDDCNGSKNIVDFYFADAMNCPYQYDGVVHVEMYIAE